MLRGHVSQKEAVPKKSELEMVVDFTGAHNNRNFGFDCVGGKKVL